MSNIMERADALIQGATEMKSEISIYGEEQKAIGDSAGYTRGFDEGLKQAGQLNGTDKIYSDAEMNEQIAKDQAALEAAKLELQSQIDGLNSQLASAGPDAVAAFKADFKAKAIAQQTEESASESALLALLD